ncbi:DUF3137 domain-containing protein [Spiroplasma endosymbiont of Panorpa germanica]|uniref:DUF3137 domain-containing protein n=1 Tax=Spiroplasma endosymbiont of Panorpa germanica TaxID=3066314 RepID=UPI0030D0F1C5
MEQEVTLEDYVREDVKKKYKTHLETYKKPSKKGVLISLFGIIVCILVFVINYFYLGHSSQIWALIETFVLFGLMPASVVLFFVFGIKYLRKINSFKTNFVRSLDAAKYYSMELKKQSNGRITNSGLSYAFDKSIFNLKNRIKGPYRVSVNDVLIVVIDDHIITYGVVTSYTRIQYSSKKSPTYVPHVQNFVVGNFPNKIETPTNLTFAKFKGSLGYNYEKVKLESEEFNQRVKVQSKDQILVRKFFTPKKMNKLLEVTDDKNKAKFQYLLMCDNDLLGEVDPRFARHNVDHSFRKFNLSKTLSSFVNTICDKVRLESKDFINILSVLDILELFPTD